MRYLTDADFIDMSLRPSLKYRMKRLIKTISRQAGKILSFISKPVRYASIRKGNKELMETLFSEQHYAKMVTFFKDNDLPLEGCSIAFIQKVDIMGDIIQFQFPKDEGSRYINIPMFNQGKQRTLIDILNSLLGAYKSE